MPTTNKYRIVKRGKIRKGDKYNMVLHTGDEQILCEELNNPNSAYHNLIVEPDQRTICAIGKTIASANAEGFFIMRKISK